MNTATPAAVALADLRAFQARYAAEPDAGSPARELEKEKRRLLDSHHELLLRVQEDHADALHAQAMAAIASFEVEGRRDERAGSLTAVSSAYARHRYLSDFKGRLSLELAIEILETAITPAPTTPAAA